MATKRPIKKVPSLKQSKLSKEGMLAVIAFILPLIAWIIGALINPSGWATREPLTVFGSLSLLPILYWPITLIFFILVCIYFYYRKATTKNITILFLILSIILSAYIYQVTVSADETEFTG